MNRFCTKGVHWDMDSSGCCVSRMFVLTWKRKPLVRYGTYLMVRQTANVNVVEFELLVCLYFAIYIEANKYVSEKKKKDYCVRSFRRFRPHPRWI